MSDVRVDPLLSYARRVGDAVQVILEVTGDPPGASGVTLRLRGGGSVDHPAEVRQGTSGRFTVEALVPAERLGDGTWRMKLIDPSRGEPQNLQTRLLIRSGMPVALLPGRPPHTVLPEPAPRS